MINSFIPPDLAVAPNPLGLAPNLKLVTVPIDAQTFFELWAPSESSRLIADEAMLLKDDRLRLEEICGKLTWLLGAKLLAGERCTQELIYDWQSLVNLIRHSGKPFDLITIEHSPQAIVPTTSEDGIPQAWMIQPSTWHILFWELVSVDRSYATVELPIRLLITYGPTTTKPIEAATVGMRYA